MNLPRKYLSRMILISLGFAALCAPLRADNFILNGSFEQSTYTVNHQFGFVPGFFDQGVTNWFGSGYAIYFFAGRQTLDNAVGLLSGTGKEKLSLPSTLLSPDGGNFIGLDGDPNAASTVSTTFAGLTPGGTYNLTFYWAASQLQSVSGTLATDERIQAQVTNGSIIDLTYTSPFVNTPSQGFTIDQTTHNWFKVTASFVASGSNEALTFFARSNNTGLPPFVLLDGVSVTAAPEPRTLTLLALGTALVFGVALKRRRRSRDSTS